MSHKQLEYSSLLLSLELSLFHISELFTRDADYLTYLLKQFVFIYGLLVTHLLEHLQAVRQGLLKKR